MATASRVCEGVLGVLQGGGSQSGFDPITLGTAGTDELSWYCGECPRLTWTW